MYQSSWGLSFLPKKSYCFKFLDKKEFIFFNYLVKIYLTTLLAVQTVVKNLGQWGRSRLNSAETIYTKVRCPLLSECIFMYYMLQYGGLAFAIFSGLVCVICAVYVIQYG